MPSSSSTRTGATRNLKDAPVEGLPAIKYHLPIVATIFATLIVVLILGILTLFAFGKVAFQLNQANGTNSDDAAVTVGFCGMLGVLGALCTLYFIVALVNGVRDLFAPVHYARGTVLDKRILGGRKTGNWMGVGVRYAGPDFATAKEITDDQRAASPDRSKIVQPRFSQGPAAPSTPGARRSSSYLPTDRITEQVVTSNTPPDPAAPRVVYRVDPASFEALDPGEEILIAYSRHLQHIFYVAHLKGGEWESYINKQLI
ncbi:MAG TPA: hypothetical protein VJ183_04365 [Chloroflexia bacterium]|nr:hypothetical protein [Chloroflexia bacterium]